MILSQRTCQDAFSIVETSMAAAVSALFLASLFAMNSASMQTLKMGRESACASQVLQQRVESLRIANWHQITDADWLKENILQTDAAGSDLLKSESETLTLIPYGSSTTGNTQLSRNYGSPPVIVNRNTELLKENAIKIIWTVNYQGSPNNRPLSRQTVAIVGKGGVAKW
jgi:uncharacterized protein (TIGR02598 family)